MAKSGESVTTDHLNLDLQNLLASKGYNPLAENCALLAVIADAHIFLGTEYPQYRMETYNEELIEEINSLNNLVTDLVVAGDLITYHSMTPGIVAHAHHRAWAIEEFDLAIDQLAKFDYRTWIVPGNHDTTAYEENADLFREKMQVPAYQKAMLGGVPVFFLNSGNAGMLDPVQEAWLRSEIAQISRDQEVLIVAHIPPFFTKWTHAGHKKIIVDALQNHRGTVWVISGHNHAFAERKYRHGNVNFIQTQTTAASSYKPQLFGDRRNPGYTLIALQDGKVVSRIFRSLQDTGYQLQSDHSQMTVHPVLFIFDDILFPMGIYEEGFYDREESVTSLSGVPVGSYIAYCKKIILKIDPANYLGKLDELVIAGVIKSSNVPLCSISLSGEDETWEDVPFPVAYGGGLYRVKIPEAFKNKIHYVKLDTGLTWSTHGFSMSGWALSADGNELNRYEKWVTYHYKTLEKTAQIHPDSIMPGETQSNILNFAFNLMPIGDASISGSPKIQRVLLKDEVEEYTSITFARMRGEPGSDVLYTIEDSDDMKVWSPVELSRIQENILQRTEAWEKVECKVALGDAQQFYRVRLVHPYAWGQEA